jgi:acyl-coenzyme A thioesterase PaaI-like protein
VHIRTDDTAAINPMNSDETAETAARRRLGTAIRNLQHRLVGRSIDPQTIKDLATQLEDLSAQLDPLPPRRRPPSSWATLADITVPNEGDTLDAGYGDRPFGGWSSPYSLELDVIRRGDHVVTEFMLRSAHEGAPGRAHGGIVAALFDDLTGFVLQIAAARAYTGELKVRYEAPVPLDVTLIARAHLRGREGRKLFIDGELHHGEQRLATVQTIYITAPNIAQATP